jgi:hypothetical protein
MAKSKEYEFSYFLTRLGRLLILRSKNVGWVNGLLMTLQMEKLVITILASNYRIENHLPIGAGYFG